MLGAHLDSETIHDSCLVMVLVKTMTSQDLEPVFPYMVKSLDVLAPAFANFTSSSVRGSAESS